MKKLLVMLMVLGFVVTLSGCGGAPEGTPTGQGEEVIQPGTQADRHRDEDTPAEPAAPAEGEAPAAQ